jgi:hypothetical protein
MRKVIAALVTAAILAPTWAEAEMVLMGNWNLSEASDGVAPDSSGNGLDGIIYGNPTLLVGAGLHFDGVDDYIEIPNTTEWNFANGFTLKASVRYSDPQGYHDAFIVGKHVGDVPAGYGLGVFSPNYDNQMFLMAQPGDGPGAERIIGGDYMDGNWHDLMGIYDGTSLSLYVDGELKARRDSWRYDSFSTANIRIAAIVPGNDDVKFHGDIGEVQIYEAVPEPSTLAILGASAIGLLAYVWRKRRVPVIDRGGADE